MQQNLSDINIDYNGTPLTDEAILSNPFDQFEVWFHEITGTHNTQPNVMILSTFGENGFPQSRVVLLKRYSELGFDFFTNYNSQKGKAIERNDRVSLTFYWPELERQIRIEGHAHKTGSAESEDYFNSRPYESRISAVASPQSQQVESRLALENMVKKQTRELDGKQPARPSNWGGYCVKPQSIEFWQGRPNRLHDRILYTYRNGKWIHCRLAP